MKGGFLDLYVFKIEWVNIYSYSSMWIGFGMGVDQWVRK